MMKSKKSDTALFLDNGGSVYMMAGVDIEDMDAIYLYATELIHNGNFQEAKRLLYFLVTLNHWNFDYCFYLSECFQKLGEYEQAINYLVRCVQIDVSDARIYFKLGYIYYLLNEHEKSKEGFKMAIRWSKGREEFRYIENACNKFMEKLSDTQE